jgi:Bacterial regulatory protein, arsR family
VDLDESGRALLQKLSDALEDLIRAGPLAAHSSRSAQRSRQAAKVELDAELEFVGPRSLDEIGGRAKRNGKQFHTLQKAELGQENAWEHRINCIARVREYLGAVLALPWTRAHQREAVSLLALQRVLPREVVNESKPLIPRHSIERDIEMSLFFKCNKSEMNKARRATHGLISLAPTPATETAAPRPVLHPDDVKILRALAAQPTTVSQYDLEAAAELSRKTISDRLTGLRKAGLTHRPNGERGGEAITDAGRTELSVDDPESAH